MVWGRYLLYFVSIALATWLLTRLEIDFPGSLQLHVVLNEADGFGTSEYSPIEMIQAVVLGACGMLMAWVAHFCPSQRPVAFLFGGAALAFLIRELHFFIDRYLIENLWQVFVGVAAAFLIAYTYRQRRRLPVAFARLWPSPGLALLFAGAAILFAFAPLIGDEPLWQSVLGDRYQRVVKLAVEEFIELIGYFLWLIGALEYTYQSRAIAYREPERAIRRLRNKRRHDKQAPY